MDVELVAARLCGIGKHQQVHHPAEPHGRRACGTHGMAAAAFLASSRRGDLSRPYDFNDKGPGAVELMAMLAIKRRRDRDQSRRRPSPWATRKKWKMARDGFVYHEASVLSMFGDLLNEGAVFTVVDNKRKVYVVEITEKAPARRGSGKPAERVWSRSPSAELVVTRLNRGAGEIQPGQCLIHVPSGAGRMIPTIAQLDHGRGAARSASAPKNPAFQDKFVSIWARTCSSTSRPPCCLRASSMISETANAEIDRRLLEVTNPQTVPNDIKRMATTASRSTCRRTFSRSRRLLRLLLMN